jgi:enoyl-CoA hydratase
VGHYEFLDLTVKNGMATVRLNRPPVNALNIETYLEIAGVFQEIGQRDDVRVAIFTGAGRCFSAGRDIKVASTESQDARFQAIFDGTTALLHCAVPVIGAVNGPAVGAGFALVLYCDIILAADSAVFSWPEINLGLSGGMALTLRGLTTYQARKLCFTGDPVAGHDLHRMGVVDEVVPDDELMPKANELAAKLAAKAPTALRAAKRTANEVEKMIDFELAFVAVESRVSRSLVETADHKEAVAAFQQRRARVFGS